MLRVYLYSGSSRKKERFCSSYKSSLTRDCFHPNLWERLARRVGRGECVLGCTCAIPCVCVFGLIINHCEALPRCNAPHLCAFSHLDMVAKTESLSVRAWYVSIGVPACDRYTLGLQSARTTVTPRLTPYLAVSLVLDDGSDPNNHVNNLGPWTRLALSSLRCFHALWPCLVFSLLREPRTVRIVCA